MHPSSVPGSGERERTSFIIPKGFLLDSHISADVAAGVKRVLPACGIHHLARWRDGQFRNADDEQIFLAAREEGLVFVTYDVRTIPLTVAALIASGQTPAGVVFVAARTIQANNVGSIVRDLTSLYSRFEVLEPSYRVVWLERQGERRISRQQAGRCHE